MWFKRFMWERLYARLVSSQPYLPAAGAAGSDPAAHGRAGHGPPPSCAAGAAAARAAAAGRPPAAAAGAEAFRGSRGRQVAKRPVWPEPGAHGLLAFEDDPGRGGVIVGLPSALFPGAVRGLAQEAGSAAGEMVAAGADVGTGAAKFASAFAGGSVGVVEAAWRGMCLLGADIAGSSGRVFVVGKDRRADLGRKL
ncbi:unnamed protein product [Prorocentrum cordatum]|uniref:H(+)-exporting diphosphatase n=1 Tax=Prorocentrum cordatum TaxID=2364126 RepID=A0ABN9XL80_9DINO|nr:unnamed protein product [Polarella glacialis]